MATSQPLVPKDRPYGERQQIVADMQRAGVPTAPRQAPDLAAVPAPTGQPAQGVPPNFDVFANREPTQPQSMPQAFPPVTVHGQLMQTAVESPNPFIREFASRVAQARRA